MVAHEPSGRTVARDRIVEQLRQLGVRAGGVVLVHTGFSSVRPVKGGPSGLIDALLRALGDEGTLAMPSLADTDDEPFDRASTPCLDMGIVAQTFWQMPGVLRSDSPHAFAAIGPRADEVTAPHPVEVPHGLSSPVGRVYELDGQVLLIGVGHDANTTIHLAENLAGVRYGISHQAKMAVAGRRLVRTFVEVDHCCERFGLMDGWLEAEGKQKRGIVGHAEARLARSRDIVATALARLGEDETVFLHPAGVCPECDAARSSLPG